MLKQFNPVSDSEDLLSKLRDAQQTHAASLLSLPGVVAVSIGHKIKSGFNTQRLCLKIYVQHKRHPGDLPEAEHVPSFVTITSQESLETDVDQMEIPSAPLPPLDPVLNARLVSTGLGAGDMRAYTRPAIGGLSAANARFAIGTIATEVEDGKDANTHYLLSNNHVFALLNSGVIGEPILQPALEDGGSYPACALAQLSRWIPLELGPDSKNQVDAALAYLPRPLSATAGIAYLGALTGVLPQEQLSVGTIVRKVGRTTGLTQGEVIGIHASTKVNYAVAGYGNKGTLLVNQVLTSPMAGYGDSGSLLVDGQMNGVGMLAAGSTTATVFNYLSAIEACLGVKVAF